MKKKNENTPEVPIASSFEELIKRELTKYDAVVPAVNELAKEFLPLKIESIEDKEGYTEVSKALRFIVSKRTAVEEKRKELKADSLAFGKAVDARAKEITAMLEPIETHLKNEKLRIDAEVERIKAEEEERKQQAINLRINKLMDLGMFQTINEFVWKSKLNPEQEETFLRVNLELFSDEDFEDFVTNLSEIVRAENETIALREAEQKAEAERIEFMRKELEDEKERMAKEMREMKEQRAIARNEALAQLGLGVVSFNPYWLFSSKSKSLERIIPIVHQDEVLNLDSEQWKLKFEHIKIQVDSLKQKDADAEAEEVEELKQKIKEDELKKLEEEKLAKEKAEAEEKERLAGMSDKDLYTDYLDRLKQVPTPELKTKKWQNYILTIIKAIDNFKNMN